MTLEWDRRALDQVLQGRAAEQKLMDLGWEVARDAAAHAPKDSGEGAKSIHPVLVKHGTDGEPEVHISWDRDHFYMSFHELGTADQPGLAFLRNAVNRLKGR